MIMQKFISLKAKRIIICIVFNLVLELWVHGLGRFINPVLMLSLFLMYLSYYLILFDLIARLNLRDYHVILIGFIYGMLQETLNTGSVFNDAFFLGVNPINILLINILWWGILQSVFTYYFANTVVKNNKDEPQRMGMLGWVFAIGINIFFFMVPLIEGNSPKNGTITGYFISLIIIAIAVISFVLVKKPENVMKVKRVRFVDILMRVQIIISVVMGIMHTILLGEIAMYLFIAWSIFTGIVYLVFVLKGYKFCGLIELI